MRASKEKGMGEIMLLCPARGPWVSISPARCHLEAAHEAAALERAQEYAMAHLSWLDAGRLAVLPPDRHWCESRALWCEKRANLLRLNGE